MTDFEMRVVVFGLGILIVACFVLVVLITIQALMQHRRNKRNEGVFPISFRCCWCDEDQPLEKLSAGSAEMLLCKKCKDEIPTVQD